MARQFKLSKTSLKKIEKFQKAKELNSDIFDELYNIIITDVKLIKECSEKSIVDFYLSEFNIFYSNNPKDFYTDDEWLSLKSKVRTRLVQKYVGNKTFDNNIDIYFNEVKKEYILHPQNESEELEFCEKNRDIFIKNNLKLAVNCAKRYRGLGLPFEDLIQIANLGLLIAFNKFDTERSNLRASIIKDIKSQRNHKFEFDEIKDILTKNFKYTKLLDSTLNKIPKDGFENKFDFLDWANANIKGASFSSISFFWIRAIIISELNNYSKIIKVPKTVLNENEESNNISVIRLDSINPYTEDNYIDGQISEVANEEFAIEDSSMEEQERQSTFKELVNRVLYKLNPLDRRIVIKRFGIGLPFPISIADIAENENISVNKIKYILTNAMKVIQNNISPDDKNTISELLK